MIGVYKITSPSKKIYVGSSNDIDNRLCSYKNLKCKNQRKLYHSLKKYGWEEHDFVILEICSIDVLLEREFYYGKKFNVLSREYGLNCRLPKVGEKYSYMSEETKRKISESNKIAQKGLKKGFYKSPLKSLTKEEVKEIKTLLLENKLTQKEIAQIYDASRKTISNINTGKCYASVLPKLDLSKSSKMYEKLNKKDYEEIRNLYNKKKLSQKKIAEMYNVDQSNISRIVNFKRSK